MEDKNLITNSKNILKGLIIFFAIILVVAVAGCSQTGTPTSTTSPTSPSPSSAAIPTASPQPQGKPVTSLPATTTPSNAATSPAATTPTTSPAANTQPSSAVSTAVYIPSATSGAAPLVEGSPVILITAPITVSTVAAGDITVNTVVSNFNLLDKIGQANAKGEGYIIYYLDATPPTLGGQAATTDTGTYAESAATSYTWQNVGAGARYFSAQLVNNDGTPLSPAIKVTVYITVQ